MRLPSLRSVIRFNPLYWRPWSATRCVIGVSVPLFWGAIVGHPAWGVLACLGALYAGFHSFRGIYVSRIRRMLVTTSIMTVMTFFGSLVSGHPVAATIVVALGAFGLALFSSLNLAALLVSIQGTALIVVLAGIGASGQNPVGNALLVLAGGLVQILLLSIIWPLNPRYPERRAVERIYTSLAQFVRELRTGEGESIPDAVPFQEAREMLSRLKRQPLDLLYSVRVGETVRAGLVGLAKADRELRREGDLGVARADAVAIHVEAALRQVAQSIRHERPLTAELEIEPTNHSEWKEHEQWANLLREAVNRLKNPPDYVPPLISDQERLSLRRLFSSATIRSLSVQHAVRYGMGVGIAFALAEIWHAPRAYWLPLSTCILLRADYATTLNRGLARLVGTIAGVVIASGIASMHPSPPVLTAIILAVTWLGCAVYLANYALFTACVTCYAVFLVSASTDVEHAAAMERLLATLGGAAIAIGANLIWPIWQTKKVAVVLRDAIESQIRYGETVQALFAGAPLTTADEARHVARALRTEAERIVQAAEIEPAWKSHAQPGWAHEILQRIDENAAIMLTLHAEAVEEQSGRIPVDTNRLARIRAVLESTRDLRRLLAEGAKPKGVSAPTPQAVR